MSGKVLLVIQSAANKANFVNAMPPLGILYIASYLESKGIKADVLDCTVGDAGVPDGRGYDLVGFSVNCGNITNTLAMARRLKKESGVKIVVGGPQVTADPDFFMTKEYIDGAVTGEGEHTLHEYLEKEAPVPGMYVRDKNGDVAAGGARPFIKDLDSLPFPALQKIDFTKYNVPIKKRKPTSTVMTSRGCPFQCIFCFHPLGYAFRPRSPQNVIEEVEWQVKELGVREVCVQDDNVSLDMGRAKEIFRGLADRKLDMTMQLYNGIRADRVDEELLRLMKAARLWLMNVSPESGDPESVKRIKKGFNLEASKAAIKLSKRMGFFTYSNFMVGFPWETREEIKRTIDFALELDTDMVQFARVVAFPNTELYSMCNLTYKLEEDIGLFYSDPRFNISRLSDGEINGLIKECYRKVYLNPLRMARILRHLSVSDIYALFKYSLSTGSI
ncbi:MAG: radical SAM protein [Candidatus Omnitrophota bacterium]